MYPAGIVWDAHVIPNKGIFRLQNSVDIFVYLLNIYLCLHKKKVLYDIGGLIGRILSFLNTVFKHKKNCCDKRV